MLLPFTFNHRSFLFISFMSNRKYSYIFSAVISSGNILSQSLTGLLSTLQLILKIDKISYVNAKIGECIGP